MSCSCWPDSSSTCSQVARKVVTVALGSESTISSRARTAVSGVRSSWDALATKRRWASNAPSSRPSRPSIVSASSRSSSGGPPIDSRRLRFASEISWVVVVIVRSGCRTRPATTHPSAVEMSAISARAMADSMMSWCRSATRWVNTTAPTAC